MYQLGQARIVSVGKSLPAERVHPCDMVSEVGAEKYGVSEMLIEETLGINEVRHSAENVKPSDLAVEASEEAIAKSGINADHIDVIVFCGIEGDYVEPSTAHSIQHRLGLRGICFDVSNACLGFMSGIQIANDMIGSGSARYVLVCTGERPSVISKAVIRCLRNSNNADDFKNKLGMLSVGDAGGAAILGPREAGHGFVNFGAASIGKHARLCYYKMHGDEVDGQMVMGRICALTINLHEQVFRQTIDQLGWDSGKIAYCITHQVGRRPFEMLSEAFHVVDSRMTRTYPDLGNITSATLPVNLCLAQENGGLKPGEAVYVALSGSGISVSHAGLIM